MAEYTNTRATIGEQNTVDGLIDRSLTSLIEDGVGNLESYALYKNTALTEVEFPGISQIKANALDGCTNLETVKLGGYDTSGAITIAANAFNGDTKLAHLLIDRPSMATLSATSAFTGTKIASQNGAIYVPENLLATYKANVNWKNYFITTLDKYPLTDFSTIADSWEQIFANANYATDYSLGDTRQMELSDGTLLYMQPVLFDGEDKTDGSGKAKISWLCKSIYATHRMNATATTSGGWAESEMRTWLNDTVYPLIPETIRNHIVAVNKTYRSKSPNDETLTCSDKIWIPSYKEVGFTDTTYIESDGVFYSGVFVSGTGTAAKNSRIKYNASGSAYGWWLRSAYNSANFRGVNYIGNEYVYGANGALGVVFGFCTD